MPLVPPQVQNVDDLVGWLVFNGLSVLIGYLIPKLVYIYIYIYMKLFRDEKIKSLENDFICENICQC